MRRRSSLTLSLLAMVALLLGAPVAHAQGVLELLFGAQLLKSIFHQPSGKVEQLGMQPQLMPFFDGFAPGDPIYLPNGSKQRIIPWFAAGDRDWDWVQFKVVSPSGYKFDHKRTRAEAQKMAKEDKRGTEFWGFDVPFDEPGYWFIEGAGRQAGKGAMSAPTSAMVLVLTADEYRIFSVEKARRIKAGTWNPFGDATPDTLKGGGSEHAEQNSGNGVEISGQPTQKSPKLETKLQTPPPAPSLYCQKAWSGEAAEYDETLDQGVRDGRVETRYRHFLVQASVSNSTQYLEYIVYKGEKEVGRVRCGKREQFALDLKLPATAGQFVIEVVALNDHDQRSAPKRVEVTTR